MANTKIQSEQIADSAITTDRIAADAITTAKIADNVALGGSPTTTTQSSSDNSTKIATTAYVTAAVADIIDSAPDTLNTLNEIAAALNDDANFNTTVTNSIAAKLPLAGGTMTGALNMGSQNITNVANVISPSGSPLVLTGDSGANIELYGSGGSNNIYIDAAQVNYRGTNGSGAGSIAIGTTVVIDGSRNLTNIGTISSGALTISQSADLHNQFISTGGDSKLSLVSADSKDAWINLSGATNEISIGYERTSSEFRVCNADTLASNVRLAINSSTGNATFTGNIKTTGYLEVASSQPRILLDRGDGSYSWNIYNGDGTGNFALSTFNIANNGGTAVLTLLDNGNATFAGNITAGNNGNINIPTASSGNANLSFDGSNFTIVSNSSSANLKLQTNSQDTLTIAANGNLTHHRGTATFGNTDVSNLYVADDIGHDGDADTYFSFENDYLALYTGGKKTLVSNDNLEIMSDQAHLGSGVYDMSMGAGAKAHGTFISPYMTLSTRYGSWDANIGCNARSNIGQTSGGTEQATAYGGGGASNLYVGFTTLNWYHWPSSVTNTLGTNLPISSAYQMMVSDSGGNLNINGTYYNNASDRRLKDNITPISNAVDKVKQLTGNTFTWKTDDSLPIPEQFVGQKDVGVIAQEVQAVVPEAIGLSPWDIEYKEIDNPDYKADAEPPIPQKIQSKDVSSESGNDYLTVNEEKLVPLLIEAIKEQQVIIDDLKSRIEALEG